MTIWVTESNRTLLNTNVNWSDVFGPLSWNFGKSHINTKSLFSLYFLLSTPRCPPPPCTPHGAASVHLPPPAAALHGRLLAPGPLPHRLVARPQWPPMPLVTQRIPSEASLRRWRPQAEVSKTTDSPKQQKNNEKNLTTKEWERLIWKLFSLVLHLRQI